MDIAKKLGHTLLTKHLRKNALPGMEVYVDKGSTDKEREKKIMDKVSKNLNSSHPTVGLGRVDESLKVLIESIIEEELENLEEFVALGGGGIVGYTLPLGMGTEKSHKKLKNKK